MTILITGAAGRTSGYVLRALTGTASDHLDVRLLVHSEAASQRLQAQFPQLPQSAFVVGDFLEASTLKPAVRDVDVVFHNAPTFHPQETAMGIALIDAAKAAGVKHFVYCSVLFPILSKMLHHKIKCSVEEYLVESGLNYTILQPTSFMQNVNLQVATATSKIPAAYSPQTLQGYLDLQDLAAVARLVLLHPELHNRARYELVGQNGTLEDVAREVSSHLGREITCNPVPREVVIEHGLHGAQDDYAAEAFDRMLYYYEKRGIPGNSNVLRWLLGREPVTWAAFLQRELPKP